MHVMCAMAAEVETPSCGKKKQKKKKLLFTTSLPRGN